MASNSPITSRRTRWLAPRRRRTWCSVARCVGLPRNSPTLASSRKSRWKASTIPSRRYSWLSPQIGAGTARPPSRVRAGTARPRREQMLSITRRGRAVPPPPPNRPPGGGTATGPPRAPPRLPSRTDVVNNAAGTGRPPSSPESPAGGGNGDRPAGRSAEFKWGAGIHTLIAGGGASHDFARWFNHADSATLADGAKASVNYTDQPSEILPALKNLQVLYLSLNQPVTDPALRKAIFDFADYEKGLLLVHPALWYNWSDWPEYNRVLVGGGARSHDKYAVV